MKVIGQPETYSDVLERVFVTTLFTGFVCTFVLGQASPEVKRILDSINTDTELGPIKGLKLLYVAIPALLALFSRVIKLHDRVSDLLRLRSVIDTRWILIPLAEGVGLHVDHERQHWIRVRRRDALYQVFYPYVSLPDAKIDKQLVRSALDNLGWFWVVVEANVLLIVTTIFLYLLDAFSLAIGMLAVAILTSALAVALWFACKRTSTAEVSAILQAPDRSTAIRNYFTKQWTTSVAPLTIPSSTTQPMEETIARYDVFISHAFEDKDSIARPLYLALQAKGVSVWFDEATLELGDSLRRKIDEGLARCRYGVVILSPKFLAKQWPQRELDGLVARETISGEKAILPVWHDLDASTLARYSPPLADKLAARSAEGIPAIVEKILRVLRKTGI
jgi:TIR domain